MDMHAGVEMYPPAGHGIDPEGQSNCLEPVDEDLGEPFSGSSGLGSRAAPSRPTSASLAARACTPKPSKRRPSSARPSSAKLSTSASGPGGERQQTPRRPSSAHSLQRNGRPAAAAARPAMMPLTAAARGFGQAAPHAVAQLREQSQCQASLIEDQQAELQLLKAVLHERAAHVHSSDEAEDEEVSGEKSHGCGAEEVAPCQWQTGLTSSPLPGRLGSSDLGARWDSSRSPGKKRRPTSAGGVGVERARQVLQFHGRFNGR